MREEIKERIIKHLNFLIKDFFDKKEMKILLTG